MTTKENCNCQHEQGHSFECPLYVEPENPITTNAKIEEFLRESNAIEGVYDDDSFKQAKYAWKYLTTENAMSASVTLK